MTRLGIGRPIALIERNEDAALLRVTTNSPYWARRNSMQEVILITSAAGGLGALSARALAKAGHTVYACMRETKRRNALRAKATKRFAAENSVDLRTAPIWSR
jgi:NADPH:quinone reductase-like Zn-dependent oxidoreductase